MRSGRSLLTTILVMALLPLVGHAQTKKTPPPPAVGSAEWLVKMYYVEHNPPNLNDYLGGDMLKRAEDPPMGSIVPSWVKTSYRAVEVTPDRAVYAITYRDTSDTRDVYCYLSRNGATWRIMATMWMSTYEQYSGPIAELRATKNRTDSMNMELDRMQLSVLSDSALKAYFRVHRKQLDSILAITRKFSGLFMLRTRCGDPSFEAEFGGLYPVVCPMFKAAKIWALYHGTQACPAGTFFEVGGYQANTVGFLYVPEGASPPPMTTAAYFLIDKISPHWYLYKTD